MTTILIVDDHPTNREFLVTLLGYRGYKTLEAGDGSEALERVRSDQPDLVIADILMPTMDGYQFVRELRSDPGIAHTPVIFYTATYLKDEAVHLAESCGVSHVLTKPCEPEYVLQVIEGILREGVDTTVSEAGEEFDKEHLRVITDKLARFADDLGEVNERFAELLEINLQLASERDPQRLLKSVCHRARKLIGTSHAIIAVGGKNADKTVYSTTSGIDPDLADTLSPPELEAGILGTVYSNRRAYRSMGADFAFSSLGLPSRYPPVNSILAAPIISISHTYGWICLTERMGGNEFSDEDERLLSILAAQVGRIYENGSLYLELQENEERFRQLAENINEVFFLTDPANTQMLYVSPAYENIWGRSRESAYSDPQSWMNAVHPDDASVAASSYEQMKRHGRFDHTFRIIRPDNEIRWIRARGFPIHNSSGEFYRVAGIADDITESRLSEEKIRRLNRVYAVLSGINTAIVRIRDTQELFNEACRIAVEAGHFRMAWIGTLSPDKDIIIPRAYTGHEEGYLQLPHYPLQEDDDPGRVSISGRAVALIQPVVRNNIDKERDDVPWKAEALTRGYRSVAAFPLIVSDAAVGVIGLYATEPDFFDEDEIKLLNELASDISYAMAFIENEARLNYQAYYDPLTGLSNRASLHHKLGETIAGRENGKFPFALILMNINGFRDINDTLSHHNGDELLRQVAQRLHSTVWETDITACLGGDDFAVLLPRLTDKGHINLIINKILHSLQHVFTISGIPVNVEATLGIALYPDHGENAGVLWQHADVALRTAKESYQNHLFYDPSIDHYDPQKLSLLGELRHAIDQDELVLYYQPKIDLRTERTAGVEALIRWQHPERGLIFPDKFIPLVERTGLINPFTTWVMANALRQVYFWHRNGFPLDLSVNLSARNIQNPNLGTEILEMVRSSRFPLNQLTVEITESAIMVDPVHAKEVLTELNRAGIGFSVDDFGTGQSSLSYLKELPISKMKIDKSFVMDFKNPRNAAIVRSTIELGHNLSLSVTAEGVEDESTFLALRDLGCDRAQGYYFSKALPPDELITWLHESPWKCTE